MNENMLLVFRPPARMDVRRVGVRWPAQPRGRCRFGDIPHVDRRLIEIQQYLAPCSAVVALRVLETVGYDQGSCIMHVVGSAGTCHEGRCGRTFERVGAVLAGTETGAGDHE